MITGTRQGVEVDNVDSAIWTSIGLGNVLKGINDRVWAAIIDEGKDVGVMIDGALVAAFTRVDDRIVGRDRRQRSGPLPNLT
jgi:hypothetical protein